MVYNTPFFYITAAIISEFVQEAYVGPRGSGSASKSIIGPPYDPPEVEKGAPVILTPLIEPQLRPLIHGYI